MNFNTEAVDDIEIRSREILQKIDHAVVDLYSLGGLEERLEFMSKFKEAILEKHLSGDRAAVDVLNWAWEKLVEAK
jgi:hypothetical protein